MKIGDSEFVRALALATSALAVSAVLLGVLSYIIYQVNADSGDNSSHTRLIKGNQFQAIFGESKIQGDSLRITSPAQRDGSYHVLITSKTSPFRAADHPVVKYQMPGLNTGLLVNLIWRSGGRLYTLPLSKQPGGMVYTSLSSEPAWQGTVSEIGLHIQGDLRGATPEMQQMALLPHTFSAWWRSIWSSWTAFRGVSPTSINVLYGSPDPKMPSPTLAATAWVALALLLLFLGGRKYFPVGATAYGMTLLLSWMAMDLSWQRDLSLQLDETSHLFGGKSMHEKHLADWGAPVYQYANRLKREVLPEEVSRIFLLHQQVIGQNFDRLKAQYHLLPHNIYNFGNAPPASGIYQGDYVLTLGDLPDLQYRDGHLLWSEGYRLRATIVDQDSMGTLYQVMPPDAAGEPHSG